MFLNEKDVYIYKLRRSQKKIIKNRVERLSDGDDSGSYHEVIRQNSATKAGGGTSQLGTGENNIAMDSAFNGNMQ